MAMRSPIKNDRTIDTAELDGDLDAVDDPLGVLPGEDDGPVELVLEHPVAAAGFIPVTRLAGGGVAKNEPSAPSRMAGADGFRSEQTIRVKNDRYFRSAVILNLPRSMGWSDFGLNHLSQIFLASPFFSISRSVSLTNFSILGLSLRMAIP